MTRWMLSFVVLLLCACSNQVIVSDPTEQSGEAARGSIPPLTTFLPEEQGVLKLVLVHGVGDHCPGFALDRRDGWLSDANAAAMGLSPLDKQPIGPESIPDSVFTDGKDLDARSKVTIMKRQFSFVTQTGKKHIVDGIEISWSQLTQWLKAKQLGYDHSIPPSITGDCVEHPTEKFAKPPARLFVNRLLKEQLLNRSLSDAIIYAGPYGASIQRGFAEALCRALIDSPVAGNCDWSKGRSNESERFIFITHSLGSRVVFDALLGLSGVRTRQYEIFSQEEWHRAHPYIEQIVGRTAAFYMMANQLSLLGLANIPPTYHSESEQIPAIAPISQNQRSNPAQEKLPSRQDSSARFPARVAATLASCGFNPLLNFSAAREQSIAKSGDLHVVAFSDTNDLLSWPVPPWYLRERDCGPSLKVVNAFVQNDTHWLAFENPLNAHVDYFSNDEVWKLIRCGAENGHQLCQ